MLGEDMHHREITKKFLDFFIKHNHLLIEDVSLVPKEFDPSALFINSGMHPIKSYFSGVEKPPSKRLCSIQKCVRTGDIEKVGNERSLTFFFMLGSWSIGDYGKELAVKLAYELLTKGFGFDHKKLWVSVFKGDRNVPRDVETLEAWLKVGIPKEKIVELPAEENFWAVGLTGPCGPCTEVHYDRGEEHGCGKKDCKPGCDCERFLEIWNAGVFMQYSRDEKGKLSSLPFMSVDTGAGLERMAILLQNKESVYETTLFWPLIKTIEKVSGKSYNGTEKRKMRIMADHIRASVFVMAENIEPSKVERGYILRRLLRRTIRYGSLIGVGKKGILEMVKSVISEYKKDYPHLEKNKDFILKTTEKEYDKFIKALNRGSKRLEKLMNELENKKIKKILDKEVFKLYDTFGFPFELTKEMIKEKGFEVNEKGFERELKRHQEVSRTSAKDMFKSGLIDKSPETVKLHTATHLLHQALREVLGKHVKQKGSNITPERLRFDFSHPKKLTDKEIKKVEDLVNKKIKENLVVKREEMSLAQAKKSGALGFFESKYGEKVSVYSVGNFSKEVCAGPHVKRTGELGYFKIIKEESVAAGIRRIKAKLL